MELQKRGHREFDGRDGERPVEVYLVEGAGRPYSWGVGPGLVRAAGDQGGPPGVVELEPALGVVSGLVGVCVEIAGG